jgi:hypothetical protein
MRPIPSFTNNAPTARRSEIYVRDGDRAAAARIAHAFSLVLGSVAAELRAATILSSTT